MTFNDDNLEDILLHVRTSQPILQENSLQALLCDNLIRNQLDDFSQGLVTAEAKVILPDPLDSDCLPSWEFPSLRNVSIGAAKHLSILGYQDAVFEDLPD